MRQALFLAASAAFLFAAPLRAADFGSPVPLETRVATLERQVAELQAQLKVADVTPAPDGSHSPCPAGAACCGDACPCCPNCPCKPGAKAAPTRDGVVCGPNGCTRVPRPVGDGWQWDASLRSRSPGATGWYRLEDAPPLPLPSASYARPATFAAPFFQNFGGGCASGRCPR